MKDEKNYLEDNMKDIDFHIIVMFSNLLEYIQVIQNVIQCYTECYTELSLLIRYLY